MSLTTFHQETGQAMRAGDPSTLKQRTRAAQELVRDKWLEGGDLHALVTAITGNWTSGNCVEFMSPVSRALVQSCEMELHRHLWSRAIKRQVESFFREYSYLRSQKFTYEELLATNADGFDEFDHNCYDDHRAAAAFLLQRLVSDIQCWKNELNTANLNTTEPDSIAASLQVLKAPKIVVPKLSPNNPFKPKPLRGSA